MRACKTKVMCKKSIGFKEFSKQQLKRSDVDTQQAIKRSVQHMDRVDRPGTVLNVPRHLGNYDIKGRLISWHLQTAAGWYFSVRFQGVWVGILRVNINPMG